MDLGNKHQMKKNKKNLNLNFHKIMTLKNEFNRRSILLEKRHFKPSSNHLFFSLKKNTPQIFLFYPYINKSRRNN